MIKVLDCTLRDGGYVNNWRFEGKNIIRIIDSLDQSEVEFIELGYLDKNAPDSDDYTKRNNHSLLKYEKKKSEYLVMINYPDYDLNNLPMRNETSIFGIRVCFKKSDMVGALSYCKKIIEKGYNVFVQPMVSMSFTSEEFLDLIHRVNDIQPYAFYIVDSFGEMNETDLIKYFYLAENDLNKSINLGFHSHNNLQLAYSNCKCFISQKSEHNLIVDSSIFGMGRGAGNLNTEIFLEYLNNYYGKHYSINPIIDVIDKVINNFYVNSFWGYSIPFYISAKNHCHPNYASFLDSKKSLTFFDIEKIIKSIDHEKKIKYDKEYIEKLYLDYQGQNEISLHINELKEKFKGKDVALIAPGKSINSNVDKIKDSIINDIVISINFSPSQYSTDYLFVSNLKRFSILNNINHQKLIITSNISSPATYIVSYFSLINSKDNISDNAGLMAIKLMISLGVKSVKLIGFDGYSISPEDDYADSSLQLPYYKNNKYLNVLIANQIKEYSKQISISFVTKSFYEELIK